ncbi:MAG: radical SAM protein, partial [Polyangiaceae bacterium]|nr:radical SAM protein [Polyangiaceae bacterium]
MSASPDSRVELDTWQSSRWQSSHGATQNYWFLATTQRLVLERLDGRWGGELSGELARDFLGEGHLLSLLGETHQDFHNAYAERQSTSEPLTLRHLLRGESWGQFYLELSGRCNERCEHCYASSGPTVSEELSWEAIDQAIQDARREGFQHLQLTGGDPLISRHFSRALALGAELQFPRLEVFTNGLALNSQVIDQLVEAGAGLAFSVYSHQPRIHDAVTNISGSHERTCRAIQLALESGLQVRVGGVTGVKEEQDALELISFLQGLGVEKIAVDRQRSIGRGDRASWKNQKESLNSDLDSLEINRGGHGEGGSAGRLCLNYLGQFTPCVFDRQTILGHVEKERLSKVLE